MTPPQVPNPEIQWLQALLRSVEAAQQAIPTLDAPTSSIGPGPAWTGTRADKVHDNDLAPAARPFAQALKNLDSGVREQLNSVPKTVSATTAKLMRDDYYYGR